LNVQRSTFNHPRQALTGVRSWRSRDLFGRADGNNAPALLAPLRSQVDHPIGAFDHIEMVFDHQNGVSGVHQALQDTQQPVNISDVQAGRRFIEDVEGAPGGAPTQFGRQFDALRLAAGEGRGWLPQANIPNPTSIRVCNFSAMDGTRSKNAAASSTVMSSTSAMFLPR